MSLQITPEFEFWAQLDPPGDIGAGPLGQRILFPVVGGEVTGDRLRGEVLGGGGDWVLVGPDGFGRIDVRLQFKTGDGALIYVQYHGLLEINQIAGQAMATAAGTRYEDQYFRTTPRLETGDSRYAWVNQSVVVARGRLLDGLRVEYQVYRVL